MCTAGGSHTKQTDGRRRVTSTWCGGERVEILRGRLLAVQYWCLHTYIHNPVPRARLLILLVPLLLLARHLLCLARVLVRARRLLVECHVGRGLHVAMDGRPRWRGGRSGCAKVVGVRGGRDASAANRAWVPHSRPAGHGGPESAYQPQPARRSPDGCPCACASLPASASSRAQQQLQRGASLP